MSKIGIMLASLALGISLCVLPSSSFADTYKVKPGDTLYKISHQFNTTTSALEALNNLNSTVLKTGQEIKLSSNGQSSIKAYKGAAKATVAAVESDSNYTVQSRDTLWRISQEYGTTVEDILALNDLESEEIYPGQHLVLPDGSEYSETVHNSLASRGSDRVSTILDYAKTFTGVPYVSGGMSPSGFDCSGYVKYVFSHFGINLPRTAGEQYNSGRKVNKSEARPGDFVAFGSGGYISHIGIYVGNDNFISATSSKGIAVACVHGAYWGSRFLGFSRMV